MLNLALHYFRQLTHSVDYPTVDELSVEQVRKNVKKLAAMAGMPPSQLADVFHLSIPTEGGNAIRLRVYRPDGVPQPSPALVWFHGGGFVLYDIDDYDGWCIFLAKEAAISVISVDYRLAPEHKFPAAHNDADHALKWIGEHASELLIDPQRLAVGGDSAGGNLAATVAVRTAVHHVKVAFQLLVYPALTFGKTNLSYQLYGKGYWLDASTMEWFQSQFLDPNRNDKDDPRLHPLYIKKPGEAPPTILAIAENDILRDEAIAYDQMLNDHGVLSRLLYFGDLGHNFLLMAGRIQSAKEALFRIAAEVRRKFNQTNTRRI